MSSDPTAGLPRPDVTPAQAISLAQELYGITGAVDELGSQQDRNFRIRTSPHSYPETTYLLKVANPEFSTTELRAQNAGLQHLSAAGVPAPQPVPGLDTKLLQHSASGLAVRLLTFLPGTPLTDAGYLAPVVAGALGDLAGRVSAALADFDHPGLQRTLQWDLQHADRVVHELAHFIVDPDRRKQVLEAAERAWHIIEPLQLRRQAVHGDITDDNVVAEPDAAGRLTPIAAIDFGDLTISWLVGELAVCISCILHHNPGELASVLAAIAAFDARVTLTDDEITALWPLVILRGAVLEVSGEQQIALDPTNAYAADGRDREWMIFTEATARSTPMMTALIRAHLGRPEIPVSIVAERSLLRFKMTTTRLYDLSIAGDAAAPITKEGAATDNPRWTEGLFSAASGSLQTAAVARAREFRLGRVQIHQPRPAANYALGLELFAGPHPVQAPVPGRVEYVADSAVTLRCNGFDLILQGLTPSVELGTEVVSGDRLGELTPAALTQPCRLWVQLTVVQDGPTPHFCTPEEAPGWRQLCPDPSTLIGSEPLTWLAPQPEPTAVVRRRQQYLAQVQELYYHVPPEIERGKRHFLFDTAGRGYLDMMNNVTILGHGHAKMQSAIADQWGRLNTNSRFNYRLIADLCEQLAELAPEGLDQVLLVNSGTEAVDLALRIAQTATGRQAVMAVKEAYHGWSVGADAVSSSVADNPTALETRPDWVQLAAAPNSYRGIHRGPSSGPRYVADIADQLVTLDASGIELAAFLAEAFYGNAGGVALPDGYLAGVYELIRGRGGLCIADEVQVGLGRLGSYFWGFEQQGVVPDIITIAKSMGNGHPLGAVITTKAIAEAFKSQGSLFSSAGGSPVSCRAGLTVLEVMREEGLQENALLVGSHLRSRLEALQDKHSLIGAVHGMGLYLGLELVRDRQTLEPARSETFAICERLLDLGVVVQPTADRQNVLKIKPPMCLTVASADYFADCLDEVLSRGW